MRRITKKELLSRGGWGFVPPELRRRPDISSSAKMAYESIASLIRRGDSDSYQGPQNSIAFEYGASRRACQMHLEELEKHGFLCIERSPGSRNSYVLISPELEGQGDLFSDTKPEPAQDSVQVEAEPAQDSVAVPAQTSAPVPAQEPAQVSGGASLLAAPPYPKKVHKKSSSKLRTEDIRNGESGSGPPDRLRIAAAAFLQRVFPDKKLAVKLLGESPPAKILWVRREIERKNGAVRNRRGLVRSLLSQETDVYEVSQAAEEVLHRDLKAVQQRERSTELVPRPRSRSEIYDWLDKQPNREDILAKAKKEAALKCAGKADISTMKYAIEGALWRLWNKCRA